VLLVGHGTRESVGLEQTQVLAGWINRSLRAWGFAGPHGLAFLELAPPDIPKAISLLSPAELRRLVVVPLMLFAAGHVRRDIPRQVAAALSGRERPQPEYLDALNDHPAVLELSLRRECEALAGRSPDDVPADRTFYLFVCRGNRDPEALAMTHRVMRYRASQSGYPHFGPAYLAIAQPSLDSALDQLAQGPWRRVVVQPHLLFQGLLNLELREKVAARAKAWPDIDWVVTNVLGPDPVLAQGIAAQIAERLRS